MENVFPELGHVATLDAVAREEALSYATLANWVRNGRLAAARVGKSYLVRREDVRQLADESRRYYGGQKRGGRVSAARRAAGRDMAQAA